MHAEQASGVSQQQSAAQSFGQHGAGKTLAVFDAGITVEAATAARFVTKGGQFGLVGLPIGGVFHQAKIKSPPHDDEAADVKKMLGQFGYVLDQACGRGVVAMPAVLLMGVKKSDFSSGFGALAGLAGIAESLMSLAELREDSTPFVPRSLTATVQI